MFELLYALFGLAVLMIVHEAGHFFVARAFGMRVERFAIGIGPTIWRHQPKGSDTIYQVGLIPFMAYVYIAGMNPFEEIDEDDKGSYANATLMGRISAIAAGPLANYIFASVFFFIAMIASGRPTEGTTITVSPDSPAQLAGMQDGDALVEIDGRSVSKWKEIPPEIKDKPGKTVELVVLRDGRKVELSVIPEKHGERGIIGVRATLEPYAWGDAAVLAVEQPAAIFAFTFQGIGRMIAGKESAQLSGPLGLMRETKKAAEAGLGAYLRVLGFLSTSLAFFNLLPIPALDGGRLMFLAYEAVTRRKANQKVEQQIHMVGMIMLLTTLVLVTYREWGSDKTPSEEAEAAHRARQEQGAEKKPEADKPNADTREASKPKNDEP